MPGQPVFDVVEDLRTRTDQALLEKVQGRIQAEAFMESPMGKKMLDRARDTAIISFLKIMMSSDVEEAVEILRKNYNHLIVADRMINWVVEMVNEGVLAESGLVARDAEEEF